MQRGRSAGLYMGLFYSFPQMVYLRMPVPVTAALTVWMCLLLTLLCMTAAYCIRKGSVLSALAIGAAWFVLDVINVTAIPIWGLAQSFARSWTAYPAALGFIEITGICGVVFVLGALQGLLVLAQHQRGARYALAILLGLTTFVNMCLWHRLPQGTLRIAAAGWVFDDRSAAIDPHNPDGFQTLFAEPARQAAAAGAKIFTTGEMGFYIADHERAEWIKRFAAVAQQGQLWLVVGYWNVTADENRLFYMSPQGEVVAEYTKTHLTPFEPGKKGTGDLKSFSVDGRTIGAMICQDDNFTTLTRRYGRQKADVVLCPTADWWTIKNAHLQAVRARAIEGRYGIVRGAANGISAIICPNGTILAKHDHYHRGPGWVVADVPLFDSITLFSRWGFWPMGMLTAILLFATPFLPRIPGRREGDGVVEQG